MPIIADSDSKGSAGTPDVAREIAAEYPQWIIFARNPDSYDLARCCDGSSHFGPTPEGLRARIALLEYELEYAKWLLKEGGLVMRRST